MTTHITEPVFLIVVADLLVAEDLRQIILERTPAAQIIIAATPEDGRAALTPDMQVKTAVITTSSQAFAGSDLAAHLAQSGTHIMLTDPWDATAVNEKGWSILPFPFTSTDVHALLSNRPVSA